MSKEGSVFDMGAGGSVPDWSEKRKPPAKPATSAQPQKPQSKAQPGRSVPTPASQQRGTPSKTPSAPQKPTQWQPTYAETRNTLRDSGRQAPSPALPSPGKGGLPTSPPPQQQPQAPQQPPAPPRIPSSPSLPITQSPTPTPTPAPTPAPAPGPTPVPYAPVTQEPAYQQPTPPSPTPEQTQQEWGPVPTPPRPARPRVDENEYEDFYDDDEDDNTSSRPRSKGKKGKNHKNAKGNSKGKKRNKKDYDPGQKTKANIIRWVTLGLLGLLCLLGIYSVVFPTKFPAPDQVVSRVQQGLGMTEFPADRAEAFVIGFTKAYLNSPASGSGRDKEAELSNYVPTSLLSELGTSSGNVDQHIVDGPYISGVRYISDEDAIFTVASRMNNEYWMYLDIPVYYNHQTLAFAISGIPAVVAQPRLSSVPAAEREWPRERDDEIINEVRTDLERYFRTWSNPEGAEDLSVFTTTNASPRAVSPILGVEFVSLSGVEVSTSGGTSESGADRRMASAIVRWRIVPPVTEEVQEIPSDEVRPSTYDMAYEVELARSSGEDKQWRVSDIRGGLRSTSALSGGEVEEETEETE